MGMFWWVDYKGGAGFIEADGAPEARAIAEKVTGKEVVRARPIPYPAEPIIFQGPGRPGVGPCPPFCYAPAQCAGRTACPKNPSCSD